MKLLKHLTIAFALTLSAASFTPAMAAGKIENASANAVKEAAESALHHTEEALSGLKNGSMEESINDHLNQARQETKRIEVGALDAKRNKASGKVRDAKTAVGKKDNAKAEADLNEAIKLYQEIVHAL
jgi:hypothetical protein